MGVPDISRFPPHWPPATLDSSAVFLCDSNSSRRLCTALEQSVDGLAVEAWPVCVPCVWCDSPAGRKVSQGNMFVELDSSLCPDDCSFPSFFLPLPKLGLGVQFSIWPGAFFPFQEPASLSTPLKRKEWVSWLCF